jgi:hypothetical protein
MIFSGGDFPFRPRRLFLRRHIGIKLSLMIERWNRGFDEFQWQQKICKLTSICGASCEAKMPRARGPSGSLQVDRAIKD